MTSIVKIDSGSKGMIEWRESGSKAASLKAFTLMGANDNIIGLGRWTWEGSR